MVMDVARRERVGYTEVPQTELNVKRRRQDSRSCEQSSGSVAGGWSVGWWMKVDAGGRQIDNKFITDGRSGTRELSFSVLCGGAEGVAAGLLGRIPRENTFSGGGRVASRGSTKKATRAL